MTFSTNTSNKNDSILPRWNAPDSAGASRRTGVSASTAEPASSQAREREDLPSSRVNASAESGVGSVASKIQNAVVEMPPRQKAALKASLSVGVAGLASNAAMCAALLYRPGAKINEESAPAVLTALTGVTAGMTMAAAGAAALINKVREEEFKKR